MVQVGIETLAGVSVTILLMLVFLGVVVMWDVALALRDVAEKIDSLEDDVDSDLDTINGTLTRIHDSMRGDGQGRGGGRRAATADGRGAVADRQPQSGAARAPTPNVATPGVGTPTASSGQSTGGGLQATHPSPEGVVGQVQLANGRSGWSGSDAEGPAGVATAATGMSAAGPASEAAGVDARSVGVDEFGPDTDASEETDAETTRGDGETAADEGDAAADTDEADEADEAASPESDGAQDADADDVTDDEDVAAPEGEDDTADESGDESAADVADAEAADGEAADGEETDGAGNTDAAAAESDTDDAAEDDVEDAASPAEAAAADVEHADSDDSAEVAETDDDAGDMAESDDGALDGAADEELDGSVAQLLDDDETADDGVIEPDDSATEALRTFGHDARTNRGMGPSADLFDRSDSEEADGRFATDADEPWYTTRFESHPRSSDDDAETTVGDGAATRADDAATGQTADEVDATNASPLSEFDEPAAGTDAAPDADPGTETAVEADGERENAETADGGDEDDVPSTVLDALDPDADAETAAAAALRDSEGSTGADEETAEDIEVESEAPEQDGDEAARAAGGRDDEATGDDAVDTDGGDDAGARPTPGEPMGVGDLVEQELTTLTQEVGGTSISPDVSSLPLSQGAAALDDTDYTFPLSGEAYGLTVSAENEVATLELVPDGGVEFSGASEQLFRYQFRNYLDRKESEHAELTVEDDGVVVVEIPGATGDSLDDWADALIQITDRTLYLARSEE